MKWDDDKSKEKPIRKIFKTKKVVNEFIKNIVLVSVGVLWRIVKREIIEI